MAIFTLRERMIFLADVAGSLLNTKGRAKFFESFYWRLDPGGNITLAIMERAEKQLAELIQNSDYRK